jgi:hypothetical protein
MSRFLWTQRQDLGPQPRRHAAMAFDIRRGKTVLFGGVTRSGDFYATRPEDPATWEWDGSLWTQVEDIGPAPRLLSGVAFDEARGVTVLVGGLGPQFETLGDTWTWDGSYWTQVADTGPAVYRPTMAYDAKAKVALLIAPDGATWSWDGAEWTQVADVGPKFEAVMAWDTASESVVACGWAVINGVPAGFQTWSWRDGRWGLVADIGPRLTSAYVCSASASGVIIQGGGRETTPMSSTWAWDGSHWTEVQDLGPGARSGHSMAYDSVRGRVVLFGGVVGSGTGLCNDTWEFWDHDSPV